MKNGSQPTVLDSRDYSYHRSFGSVVGILDDFCVDPGLTMPNQNNEGLPFGCTGETQTDNQCDKDKRTYNAPYTYNKTCLLEGHGPERGCDIRTSFDATQIYGFNDGSQTEAQAEEHRGGYYFNIYEDGIHDWFDSIRGAVYAQKRGASLGTPWFPTWEGANSTGILSMPTKDEFDTYLQKPWHNYSCKGSKMIDGVPYLMVKSWQGRTYGDNGWCYMSREIANKVFELYGSAAFMQTETPVDPVKLKLSMFRYMLLWISKYIATLRPLN